MTLVSHEPVLKAWPSPGRYLNREENVVKWTLRMVYVLQLNEVALRCCLSCCCCYCMMIEEVFYVM